MPNLIPDASPGSTAPPSESEKDELLHRRLTDRDVAILTALDQYRYLDQAQIQALYFPSPRACQLRTAWLREQGLVHGWLRVRPQTWRRHPSVLATSVRGAWLLANVRGQDPREAIRRSRHAVAHRFPLLHDLEANGFMIAIAIASRTREGEGLYHWVGEWGCRETYRARRAAFAPDGWGQYLSPSGEVVFLLEWDRGTESPQRIGVKASQYIPYFGGRRDAHLSNVLFVVGNTSREEAVREAV
ncbi:MAG: replication-relaxation family protein, partial [Thermoplasmata archaeon]